MSEAIAAADARPGRPRLTQLLPVDAIRIGETAADWRAAVRLADDVLVASGATTPNYTDEMGCSRPGESVISRFRIVAEYMSGANQL